MKKILIIAISLLISATANADVKKNTLNKASKIVSNFVSTVIPGEGVTEASVEIKEDEDPDFEILAVRDILSKNNSNVFTQFSLHNNEVNGDNRYIGNLGFGYRVLNKDQSIMFGINSFYDKDIQENHSRASIGFEAKASNLDITFNQYKKTTNQKIIGGTKEQVLSGNEFNISSQIPYMPWSRFNVQAYKWENEKAVNNDKGKLYALEMALSPSLQLDLSRDVSRVDGVDDTDIAKLTFVYPPRETKPTLKDGFISDVAILKENVKDKLKEKVRRNNNLVVEIQGAVIFTKK